MKEERLGGHHLIAFSSQCREERARHQFSEETQLNSMSTKLLDIKENFLTIRAASLLHQAEVCMISFHLSYFQTSWTWHRLCRKLRSTHFVAIIVKEVCAVTWRKDTLLTVILTLAFSRGKASRRLSQGEKGGFSPCIGPVICLIVVFLWVSEESFSVPFIFPLVPITCKFIC